MAETIFRCSSCNKISSAKVMPKSHKRWVREGVDKEFNPKYDESPHDWDGPGGHFIICGPFIRYLVATESEFMDALSQIAFDYGP